VKVYKGSNNSGVLLAPGNYTVTSAGKALTISFANVLDEESNYYVELQGGTLKDFKGEAIATQGAGFKTVGRLTSVSQPANNGTHVSIQIKPTITFSKAVTSLGELN